jgi:predicted MFS family arabinose efflux permease
MHSNSPATLDYAPAAGEAVVSDGAGGQPRGFNWPLILLLTCIAGLNYCDRLALTAVYPLLRTDLQLDDVWIGWIGASFLLSYAVGSPFSGLIADRTRRTRVVLISLVAWSLVTLATGLAKDATQLVVMRFLLGLAECAYLPAAVGLLADHHGPRHRGRAIAIHTAGLGIGALAGSTLAGFIGQHWGWRLAFVILGAAGIVLAGVAVFGLRGKDLPTARESMPGAPGGALDSALDKGPWPTTIPSYWIILLQGMVAAIAVWLFLNWLPLYLTEHFGMSLAGAGFFGALLLDIPPLVGVLTGGTVSDIVARGGIARRMAVQTVCYSGAAALLLAFTSHATFAVIAASVVGFAFLRAMAASNELPLMCDLIAPRRRSFAMGLMNCANTVAGASGILAAGYLKKDFGLTTIFRGASVVILTSALLTALGFFVVLPRDLRRRGLTSR